MSDLNIEAPVDSSQTLSHIIISMKEGHFDSNNSWVPVAFIPSDPPEHRESEYTVGIDSMLAEELGRSTLGEMTLPPLQEGASPKYI